MHNSYSQALLTDFLGMFFSLGSLFILISVLQDRDRQLRILWLAGFGVAAALTGLTRPSYQLLFALAPICLYVGRPPTSRWIKEACSVVVPVVLLYGIWFSVNYSKQGFFGMSPVRGATVLMVMAQHPEVAEKIGDGPGSYPVLRDQIAHSWEDESQAHRNFQKTWTYARKTYGLVQANEALGVIANETLLTHPQIYAYGVFRNLRREFWAHWIGEYPTHFKAPVGKLLSQGDYARALEKALLVSLPEVVFQISLPLFLLGAVVLPLARWRGRQAGPGWSEMLCFGLWILYIYCIPAAFNLATVGGRYKIAAIPLQFAVVGMLVHLLIRSGLGLRRNAHSIKVV